MFVIGVRLKIPVTVSLSFIAMNIVKLDKKESIESDATNPRSEAGGSPKIPMKNAPIPDRAQPMSPKRNKVALK